MIIILIYIPIIFTCCSKWDEFNRNRVYDPFYFANETYFRLKQEY